MNCKIFNSGLLSDRLESISNRPSNHESASKNPRRNAPALKLTEAPRTASLRAQSGNANEIDAICSSFRPFSPRDLRIHGVYTAFDASPDGVNWKVVYWLKTALLRGLGVVGDDRLELPTLSV